MPTPVFSSYTLQLRGNMPKWTRRGILKAGLAISAGAASPWRAWASPLALPSKQQLAWQDLEFGMFIHFSPATWQNQEFDDLKTPLSEINPTKLDTDQWVETALALGARYIVFVAKHQGGFCMWQTHTTEYSIRNTPWRDGKGDVLAEIAASCRKKGVPLGVYVGARDDDFGAGDGGQCKAPELQRKYNELYRQQLTEVFSRYGELIEIWFDGSTIVPVSDLIRRYQPNAVVFQSPAASIRWVGNEDGVAPYPCWNAVNTAKARTGISTSSDGDPDGATWLPSEVDVSIRRPDWFWSTTNANKVLTVDQLMSVYYRSIGRGAQLLLNIPANRDGLLPQPDCETAVAFGKELTRRFGHPRGVARGTGPSLILRLDRPARIDTAAIQEEISKGERIRAYRIEGEIDGSWVTLAEGSAIGHKRIQPVDPQTVSALRLLITKSAATPLIRSFAAFNTEEPATRAGILPNPFLSSRKNASPARV
jgi:alpha-L-fucosidase